MLEHRLSCCCGGNTSQQKNDSENNERGTQRQISSRDTGWAWIIVLASFVIQLLIDGTISGFGVVFLEMQKDEAFIQANYTRTLLALPGNIQPGFFLCTGAFVSPLIRRLGFRVMGSIGSGLVGSGLALASFQRNIHLFNLFYGVLTGSGFGILMVCAIVSVNFYFERYRGIASGIAMAGSGIGCLTVPVIFNRLCDYFGWRRGLLLYSGFAMLSAWFSVITFRPFVVAVLPDDALEGKNETQPNTSGTLLSEAGKIETQTRAPFVVQNSSNPEDGKISNITQSDQEKGSGKSSREFPCNADSTELNNEEPNDATKEAAQDKFSTWFHVLRKKSCDSINGKQHVNDLGSTVGSRLWKSTLAFKRPRRNSRSHRRSVADHLHGTGSGDVHLLLPCGPQDSYVLRKNSLVIDPFKRVDIFYSGSLANLKLRDIYFLPHQTVDRTDPNDFGPGEEIFQPSSIRASQLAGLHQLSVSTVHNLNANYLGSSGSLRPFSEHWTAGGSGSFSHKVTSEDLLVTDRNDLERSVTGGTCVRRFRRHVVQLFDLNLFTSAPFLFLLVVGITNQLAYFIPFVYLVDYSMKNGLEMEQAVVFSVILGSLHTVGRIVSGFVSNSPWLDTVHLSGLGTLAAALINLALPTLFPRSFPAFAVYAALYGFFSALPVPMIHLLLVRFLGLERLTASYSNLNLAKGLASVIGPMVAVSLVDYTGEPGHYFLVAGVCLLLSATAHLGLCRFPCTRPGHSEEAVDDRAKCCFCFGLGITPDRVAEEPDLCFVDTDHPIS
ncbi:Monocarboxylate transporter 7 [Fasciola hepatica]|uniref:Monocarboxylate transporter 7 n=1 Tax=Fasciola hepatica TaxID=6192 RepID=A0A4E0RU46_FASHE|nr:Monocarboxylate transporter 7 [Fasciola hepatica]